MDALEYQRRGKEVVDFIVEYLTTIRTRRTFPDVQPGYMKRLVPDVAPQEGEKWEDIFKDVERVILPGVTHWQSPHMHAYFPALNSFPSLLGDMVADAISCLGFTWASSPACTELEIIVMDWLGAMIGLPPCFMHRNENGKGGGVLQGTLSEATLVAIFAARYRAINRERERENLSDDISDGAICSRLVVYCSDQAHSSVEKNALISLVKLRRIQSDERYSLRGTTLRKAIDEDEKKGLIPFFVCATLGTTGVCAFDNLDEIGEVCKEKKLWLHVDAAYAGTAFLCPEYRTHLHGVDKADTFAFNPSKWMMVHFDCTALWVKDREVLEKTFCVNPLYLKHEKQGMAVDFMNWQIPLSRRFRAIKLWFVIRSFGIKGLQEHVRKGVRLAKYFESLLRTEPIFEIPVECNLSLVVFRLKGKNFLTEELLRRLNATGKLYVVPAAINGLYVIRFSVTSFYTTEEDIQKDWRLICSMGNAVMRCLSPLRRRIASWPAAAAFEARPDVYMALYTESKMAALAIPDEADGYSSDTDGIDLRKSPSLYPRKPFSVQEKLSPESEENSGEDCPNGACMMNGRSNGLGDEDNKSQDDVFYHPTKGSVSLGGSMPQLNGLSVEVTKSVVVQNNEKKMGLYDIQNGLDDKPTQVSIASRGRFGALSVAKESTYTGVVNICHCSAKEDTNTLEEN
ncbi:histidine decarboxylase-like [Acanthaster planci]|uniref:Histidine decarboxylase n=1 Tax=Acanthaster planci TaxID=133434 RepID=A0A8B7ZSR6_ACAPL|nr:histidine decarboxylase-like [Acanthaster planci]XP_022106501.1 histidine decarboxylase-like [Acanthaster planci]